MRNERKAFFNRIQEGANTVSTRSSFCPTPCPHHQEWRGNSQSWNKTTPQQGSISKRRQSTGTPRIKPHRSSCLYQPEPNRRFWAIHLLWFPPSVLSFINTCTFFLVLLGLLKEPKELIIDFQNFNLITSSFLTNFFFPNLSNCLYLKDSSWVFMFYCSVPSVLCHG